MQLLSAFALASGNMYTISMRETAISSPVNKTTSKSIIIKIITDKLTTFFDIFHCIS